MKSSIKQFVKTILGYQTSTAAVAEPVKTHVWSIGIYAGQLPFQLAPAPRARNPVLTADSVSDVRAAFVADPFMVREQDTWHMFFEVMNAQAGNGEIGLATSKNAIDWQYQRIVLREPFHLSYPCTFEWNGAYYMVPESYRANAVRLYRAERFPDRWLLIKTLLDGDAFVDPTLFHFNNRWWLFADFHRPPFFAGCLRLFHADRLEGPWVEHPRSPVVQENPHIARPGGRVVLCDERLIRFTQDCSPEYGTRVRAFEITELTSTKYREQGLDSPPVVEAGVSKWNESGMHHVDAHRTGRGEWIACVDGFYWKQ